MISPIIVFILTFLSVAFASKKWTPARVPNPNLDPKGCGRPNVPKSAVCDPENLFTQESKDVIEGYMNEVKNAQMAVLVISQMDPVFVGHQGIDLASEKFAREMHDRHWQVGDKTTNDGVLIFVSIADRAIYISKGKGVSRLLTDHVLDTVIAHMKPYMRKREYSTAVEHAIVELDLVLSGRVIPEHPKPSPGYKSTSSRSDMDYNYGAWIFWGIFLVFGGGSILASY
jgi:uncharacterized membrane protein YgcG